MKKAIVIMSGYNIRAVIAFLRICDKNDIPYYIIATGYDDEIFNTGYVNHIAAVRKDKDINKIKDITKDIKNRYNLDVVYFLPTTEYLNRYLLDNRDELMSESILIPLVEDELYENISDKYKFRNLCQSHGLAITKKYDTIDDAEFPCVLKPLSYSNYMGKPILINSKDEYKEEYKGQFYLEEYVPGDSYYLLYYFRKDGSYISFSQRNYIQQPNGRSMIMAKSSDIHKEIIALNYAKMFIKEHFNGLVMVEVKEKNGEYLLIEANPRLWGPSQLMVDSNSRFFENYIKDMGFNIDATAKKTNESIYFWEDGIKCNLDELTFYSYGPDELLKEYDYLHSHDLLDRGDTKKLYKGSEFVKCKKN